MFDEKVSTPLCEIMGRNKSDKGSQQILKSWHNYTTYYHSIFKSRRFENLRVFELGIGTNNIYLPSNMGANGRPGASLYGWNEYFPNAYIFGADIDGNILFNTDKISTYFCDQTQAGIIKHMWNSPALQDPIDIIVEDGLHEVYASVCFFENSIHKLAKNGYFIIEDVRNDCLEQYKIQIKIWKEVYPDLTFDILPIPSLVNNVDNNLIVVGRPHTAQ